MYTRMTVYSRDESRNVEVGVLIVCRPVGSNIVVARDCRRHAVHSLRGQSRDPYARKARKKKPEIFTVVFELALVAQHLCALHCTAHW